MHRCTKSHLLNCWTQTFFACAYLGAALVTLNYAYARHEFVELLKVIGKLIDDNLGARPLH